MIPFRVYDRDNKLVWVVLNYHNGPGAGTYLVARDDDSDDDGSIEIIAAEDMKKFQLVGFIENNEE